MERSTRSKQEQARGLVRALHLAELESAGEARNAALAQANAQLDRIAQRLPEALDAGLSLTEVARATGVSRPTLYELRARYSDRPLHLSLGVLQTIATRGPITEEGIRVRLDRAAREIAHAIAEFERQGFVDYEVEEDENGTRPAFFLTPQGADLLEHWDFEQREGEESRP